MKVWMAKFEQFSNKIYFMGKKKEKKIAASLINVTKIFLFSLPKVNF